MRSHVSTVSVPSGGITENSRQFSDITHPRRSSLSSLPSPLSPFFSGKDA